jgi:hypothetical protein
VAAFAGTAPSPFEFGQSAGIKKFWAQLSAPISVRRLADETQSWLAKLDELRDAARGSPENAELAKLLLDLRSLLDAAGQKALGDIERIRRFGTSLR